MTVVGVLAHSGKTLGGGLGALRTLLAQHGVDDPLWREVPKSKFVPTMVAELMDAGVELLFVWGGDGSVQRCIDAVGKAPVTLAILPAGTANLFAANLGIPTDLEEAVEIGFSGRRRKLDVGTVNGERFGVMAGIGFDALMIRAADAGQKDRLGRLAYVVAGIRGIRRDAVQAKVEVDGMAWFKGRQPACSSATWARCSVAWPPSPTPVPTTDGSTSGSSPPKESSSGRARSAGRWPATPAPHRLSRR